ncbi:MAG: MmcQ/YjbR family DNA-binding protein [Balneolaceae bacterium]|nr:MAG: MmcQ/YjbR family DNA-binding protein [Balneolaceae bacterium]
MNIEEYREFCLSLPGTEERFPFDGDALVFFVMDKMYSLTNVDTFNFINLKCDPERAVVLREQYEYVLPGYHMNKKHWNSIMLDRPVPTNLIREWTRHSYDMVVANLSKKDQEELMRMAGKDGSTGTSKNSG